MRNVVLIALALVYMRGYGQDEWKLREEKDGMAVYTRTFPDSKFKAIKVELTLDATLSQLVALLLDVNAGVEWVYATKSSILLKQVSPSELYYYSEVRLPWPLSNRDFVARLTVAQDPQTKVVTIDGPTVAGYLPVKKDIVRVAKSEGRWVLAPMAGGHIRVVYTLRTDPGGDIPAWLFNLFVTKGPMESFGKMREQLKKPAYVQARLPFIVN